MEVNGLTKLLGRFKKDDYRFLFDSWPVIRSTGLRLEQAQKLGKKALFDAVSKKYQKKKPSSEVLADLDLLYHQRYPSHKQWKVFKFTKVKGKHKTKTNDASSLEDAIAEQMCLYFNGEVHVKQLSESFWIRLELQLPTKRGARPKSAITYVVYPKNTEYLLVSGLRTTHANYVMQVFLMVMNGRKMDTMHLTGRQITSLLQLVINKHTKGKLAPSRPVTKKSEDFPPNIKNENRAQKRKREDFVDSTFGQNKLPKLEHVDYKLETKFRGDQPYPGMQENDETFHCRVRFEGKNVLEGIKNLAVAGLADIPMKGHLANVHNMAQNAFILRTTQKPNDKS